MTSILFICDDNSVYGPMAAALLNQLKGHVFEARSAGLTSAAKVHPTAVAVLAEVGIDISKYRPRSVDGLELNTFDQIISLTKATIHIDFPFKTWNVPPLVAMEATGPDNLRRFRKIRDTIRMQIQDLGSAQPW